MRSDTAVSRMEFEYSTEMNVLQQESLVKQKPAIFIEVKSLMLIELIRNKATFSSTCAVTIIGVQNGSVSVSVACAVWGPRVPYGALPIGCVVASVLQRAIVRSCVEALKLCHQLVHEIRRLLLIGDGRADRILEHLLDRRTPSISQVRVRY